MQAIVAHLLDLEVWNDPAPGDNWKEMLTEGDYKETLAAPQHADRTSARQ